MNKITSLALESIAIHPKRMRALREETVKALAKSMAVQGLIQPIVVRPRAGAGFWLIAGRHRLMAAKKLKWPALDCIVLDDVSADQAELVEIDENLVRANLSPAEEAAHLGRRKELYELRHPATKRGSAGGRAKAANAKGAKSQNETEQADAFIDDTAKKTGKGRSTIARKAARAKVVVLPEIIGTSLDKGAEIDALAKLPVEKQRSLAEAAKRGEQVSAISALSACDPEAPKTSDGTGKEAARAPTLDPRAWSMATAQERQAFVKAVGRSEIEDAFNAIELVNTLTRGLNALNQAWSAATESDRRAFYGGHFPANVINRFQT